MVSTTAGGHSHLQTQMTSRQKWANKSTLQQRTVSTGVDSNTVKQEMNIEEYDENDKVSYETI